jgi:hypothetical protein
MTDVIVHVIVKLTKRQLMAGWGSRYELERSISAVLREIPGDDGGAYVPRVSFPGHGWARDSDGPDYDVPEHDAPDPSRAHLAADASLDYEPPLDAGLADAEHAAARRTHPPTFAPPSNGPVGHQPVVELHTGHDGGWCGDIQAHDPHDDCEGT